MPGKHRGGYDPKKKYNAKNIRRRIFGGQPDRPKLEAYVDRLLARPQAPKFGE